MIELKPCPFCDGKGAFVPRAVNLALQKDPSDPKFGVSVICGKCGCESANMVDETRAAEAWNRRNEAMADYGAASLIETLREQSAAACKLIDTQREEIAKLSAFFDEVAELTAHHDSSFDTAVVYPDRLDRALEKVDPNWYDGVRQVSQKEPTDDDDLQATVDLAEKMLEQLGQALGAMRNARTKLEQMAVVRAKDVDNPDYVRGYDAGFIVGAEKGRTREPDAYIDNVDADELRLKHRCHSAFLTSYGTGGATEVFFGQRRDAQCRVVEPPSVESLKIREQAIEPGVPREVPKRGDELRRAAFLAGADWARKTGTTEEVHWIDSTGTAHSMPIDAAVDELRRLYELREGGVADLEQEARHGAKFIRNSALEEAALICDKYVHVMARSMAYDIRKMKT